MSEAHLSATVVILAKRNNGIIVGPIAKDNGTALGFNTYRLHWKRSIAASNNAVAFSA